VLSWSKSVSPHVGVVSLIGSIAYNDGSEALDRLGRDCSREFGRRIVSWEVPKVPCGLSVKEEGR
jgi:hypothetical protein